MLDIIYGINTVEAAIKHGKVKKIFTDLKPEHSLIKSAKEKNLRIFPLEDFKDLDHLPQSIQKVVAIIEPYKLYSLDNLIHDDPKYILFLDKITDDQNLGAIIRSALAFNVKHIIIPKDNSAKVNEVVHKVSVGATFSVKISIVTSIQNVIKKLKKEGYWITSFDMKGTTTIKEVRENDLKQLLVMGSEGKGIRESLVKESDFVSYIPMNSELESLNVSVSTAIILYELDKKD